MSKPLRIVADKDIPFLARAFLGAADVTLLEGRGIDPAAIRDADALLVRSVTPVNEALLKDSAVRFVGSLTSGTDHVDLAYLARSRIKFAHAPGSNARPVAEYALASLFTIARRQGFALKDKTVGIIGCGHTGSYLARFLTALGVNCLKNDPPLAEKGAGGAYAALEAIFAADIISLHVPLSHAGKYQTHKLVNEYFLARLKPDVILLNTSRGEVIDEAALIRFRRQNPRATLALDVWRNEPRINPELLAETAIATPHIAGYSRGAKIRAGKMLLAALAAFTGREARMTDPNPFEKGVLEPGADIPRAVMRAYAVERDAALLGGLSGLDERQRGARFDGMRKNYTLRREFSDYIIRAHGMAPGASTTFKQLGFQVEPA